MCQHHSMCSAIQCVFAYMCKSKYYNIFMNELDGPLSLSYLYLCWHTIMGDLIMACGHLVYWRGEEGSFVWQVITNVQGLDCVPHPDPYPYPCLYPHPSGKYLIGTCTLCVCSFTYLGLSPGQLMLCNWCILCASTSTVGTCS